MTPEQMKHSSDPADRARARIAAGYEEQRRAGKAMEAAHAGRGGPLHVAQFAQRWAWHQIEDGRLALAALEAKA